MCIAVLGSCGFCGQAGKKTKGLFFRTIFEFRNRCVYTTFFSRKRNTKASKNRRSQSWTIAEEEEEKILPEGRSLCAIKPIFFFLGTRDTRKREKSVEATPERGKIRETRHIAHNWDTYFFLFFIFCFFGFLFCFSGRPRVLSHRIMSEIGYSGKEKNLSSCRFPGENSKINTTESLSF